MDWVFTFSLLTVIFSFILALGCSGWIGKVALILLVIGMVGMTAPSFFLDSSVASYFPHTF